MQFSVYEPIQRENHSVTMWEKLSKMTGGHITEANLSNKYPSNICTDDASTHYIHNDTGEHFSYCWADGKWRKHQNGELIEIPRKFKPDVLKTDTCTCLPN